MRPLVLVAALGTIAAVPPPADEQLIRPVPPGWSVRGLDVAPVADGLSWTYQMANGGRQVVTIDAKPTRSEFEQRATTSGPTTVTRISLEPDGTSYYPATDALPQSVRMPALLRADTSWSGVTMKNRVVGLADVAFGNGTRFKDCVVIEIVLPAANVTLRTYYALGVGMVFEQWHDGDRWVTTRELREWVAPKRESTRSAGESEA